MNNIYNYFSLLLNSNQFQNLYSLINDMIDAYEQKHGPVEDRSIFSGDIVVPPHLRNISLVNARSNRLHGGLFGSLSRSRTFLSLSSDTRPSLCGSVPDLSRNSINGSDMASLRSATFLRRDDASRMKTSSSLSSSAGPPPPPPPPPSALLGGYMANRNTMPPIRQLLGKTDDIELRNKSQPNRPHITHPLYGNGDVADNHDGHTVTVDSAQFDPKGYMAVIRTNHTNSLPNRRSGSALRSLAARYDLENDDDTVITPIPQSQSMPFNQHNYNFSMAYAHELSLDNIAKYTIPRVTLRSNTAVTPIQSPNSRNKFPNALKKGKGQQYDEDVSAV